ncbi:MAG: methylation-associated defense system AAA family ATPase MAD3 [Candidatus Brocadiia bacterium]
MITRIEALNYRCLRYVAQDLGPFHVLVGPNASGKSTFLDVPALIRDLLQEGLEATVASRAPNYRDLFWQQEGQSFALAVEAEIPEQVRARLRNNGPTHVRYELSIGESEEAGELQIIHERLKLRPPPRPARPLRQPRLFPAPGQPRKSIFLRSTKGWKTLINKVPGGNDNFYSETGSWDHAFKLGPRKSALANVPDDETKFPVATWFKQLMMQGVERLALNSAAMRRPCPPTVPRTFLPDGSNLPWVVQQLESKHEDLLGEWVRHVATALPDLRNIRSIERPEDKHRYLVLEYENGLGIPSWVVSDGTMRMLALTVLAYLPGLSGVYLIEEPENGIHPAAVETVFDSLTSVYDGQVLLATHSPVILSVADVRQVLCFARDGEGAADIVPGGQHPNLRHWRGESNLGVLFASGVLG